MDYTDSHRSSKAATFLVSTVARSDQASQFDQVIRFSNHPVTGVAMEDSGVYICDSCGEEVVVPLDPSAGTTQSYVEDCPVCCNPNVIHVEWVEDEPRVWAEPEQDRY